MVSVLLPAAGALLFIFLGGQYNTGNNFQYDRDISNQAVLERTHSRSASRSDFECEVDNDLIIVLDSSWAISEDDYKKAKEVVADFADAFNSHKQNRFGFTVFAILPQPILALSNIHRPDEMKKRILSAPYYGKGQRDEYFTYVLQESYSEFKLLNRSTVDQNFVLVAAGSSQEASKIPVEAAKMIKAGVRNFAVGIGDQVVRSELLAVTGGKQENILLAKNVTGLKGVLDTILQLVCFKAPVCHGRHDLMISLDTSTNIYSNDFKTGKRFISKLFDSFVINGTNNVSFRKYWTSDKSIFKLDNSLTQAQIQSTVLSTEQETGYKRTDLSLYAGIEEFKQLGRGVSKSFIIVTNGKSDFAAETKEAAERAKAAGITTFAVGIGSVRDAELLYIANGDSKRVFKLENLSELEKFVKEVSEKICSTKSFI